jgi:hypothetical protein
MNPESESSAEADNDVGSPEDTLIVFNLVVEYEVIDLIPELGQHDPVKEYMLVQQAINNNLAINEILLNHMIQKHHAMGWGVQQGDHAPFILGLHDVGQPGVLAPNDPRDEIHLAPPEHLFSDAEGD